MGHWAVHYVPSDMASHPVRIGTSTLLQWEPRNSHFTYNYLINCKAWRKSLIFLFKFGLKHFLLPYIFNVAARIV